MPAYAVHYILLVDYMCCSGAAT